MYLRTLLLQRTCLLILLVSAAYGGVSVSWTTSEVAPHKSDARVVLLGAGTPNPTRKFSSPASAVVVNGASYLVDSGDGLVVRANEAVHEKGINELKNEKLQTLFLTHLHSDHTAGLADLSITPWIMGRAAPMTVRGPIGTRKMTHHLKEAYSEDIDVRLRGLEPISESGYEFNVEEIPESGGEVYRDDNVVVSAFRVNHGAWKYAYGYKFVAGNRSIVFSGDTTPLPEVIERECNGCDVLLHEVYGMDLYNRLDAHWQNYYRHYHTSSQELAAIASRANPRVLVLYHTLFHGQTEDSLIQEIHDAGYHGIIHFGHDFDEI